ncbi:synaptopodin 2-like protein isoform X1 [Pygocentrus nattereri]|uniref:Synaptopodin 2-like protein n=1 Tax=Pygocentrus nattereri TaxID=42514 RepID=A0A3B4BRL0_PYGNA|nr:synaptopodin 2-like protein isoform X1 [Pygocentrus nattereri]
MVAEEVIITLSGGAPWGFRLQGGVEHQRPLQVAKVRKRSKACRAGLREGDELVSINDSSCGSLSHAQAMNLIDSIPGALRIRVKRAPAGFQSVVLVQRAPSPRIDKEYRAALRAKSPSSSRPQQSSVQQVYQDSVVSSTGHSGLTSPPGSEAYYGETDSDADVAAHEKQRRQKRRSPSNSPGKAGRTSPEGGETSEMSGYDSAPDAQGYTATGSEAGGDTLPGVTRREVVYQPPPAGAWSSHTSTETSSMSADDQNPAVMEEDNGFQEPVSVVPLVSPDRAKEALMLSSRGQLVPMVGPVDKPVDEELTVTYMDKAKQAKLNRGESLQDKQVKEARTKCRTIASLLTDAPNPHSKGVLMFKKRRQRSKKYTLTSYGSVDEDMQPDSQEEDGIFPGSESEFDEDGFSAAPDPIWDSEVLEMLDKRSASRGLEGEGAEDAISPGLSDTTGRGAQLFEQQRKRTEEHAKKMATAQVQLSQMQRETHTQQETQAPELSVPTETMEKYSVQPPAVAPKPARPPELMLQQDAPAAEPLISVPLHQVTPSTNGNIASVSIPVISEVPITNQPLTPTSAVMPPPPTPLPELPASSVLNRTARPFAPGFISHRASTAPVVFHPTIAKKAPRPVSVAVVAPPFTTPKEQPVDAAPTILTVGQSITVTSGMPSSLAPMSPGHHPHPAVVPDPVLSLPAQFSASVNHNLAANSAAQIAVVADSAIPAAIITAAAPSAGLTDPTTITSIAPTVTPAPEISMIPHASAAPVTPESPIAPASPVTPLSPVVYHENSSGAGGRTGILQGARHRSAHKPMFKMLDNKKNSPNPELLSMVHNLDSSPIHSYSEPVAAFQDDSYSMDNRRGRIPPPVAPKPRVIPEMSQIPQAEGKGAELFARRQSRMDLFVVDSTPTSPQQLHHHHHHHHQQQQQQQPQQHHVQPQQAQSVMAMIQPQEPSLNQSEWKYSPNIRAPPPIGYNPLLSPSCPLGLQRGGAKHSEGSSRVGRSGYGIQKEGIKAIDFMRRQPYQLNPAMFSFGGGSSTQSLGPSYQYQRQAQQGHTLTPPRQVPVKTARVYEIKRFSTPTPMSGSTLAPTVIVPRAQTTLGEPLSRSNMISPPPASSPPQPVPEPIATPARAPGLPELPKISATPIPHPTPYSPPAPMSSMLSLSYPGLQAAKQFKSAPELSALPPSPLRAPVQVPKPHFIASRAGIQPHVWRPGALHY